MKKFLILLAIVTLAAGCNKMFDANYANDLKNKPVTVTAGANINQAKTYTTNGTPKTNDQGVQEKEEGTGLDILTRHVYSTNADGDCTTWDEDYVQEEGSKASNLNVRVIKRYNFQTGKYTVTTTVSDGNSTTAIRLTLDNNQDIDINISQEGNVEKVEIVVTQKDEQGNPQGEPQKIEVELDVTAPNPSDPNATLINGTWYVKQTVANARNAVFNKEGLDIPGIAEWAKSLGLIKEEDVKATEGYTVKNVMIMDRSIAINFANGKSFASTVSSLSNFKVEDFDPNSEIGKYFNGTGSFEFSGNLCVFSIEGSVKGENESNATPISITLTLSK